MPYICSIPDPAGEPAPGDERGVVRPGRHRDRPGHRHQSGEVDRAGRRPTNHLVDRTAVAKDAPQTEIIAKWKRCPGRSAARVVGSNTEDILGDSSGNRGIETPMGDLVADAILWGT